MIFKAHCLFLLFSPVKYQNVCAGSILNSWLIISAAHCFYQETPMQFLIIPKMFNASTDVRPYHKWPYQSHKIQEIFIHERFDYSSGYNDIAIASLQSPLEVNETISFSGGNFSFHGGNCSVAGYGNHAKILTESKAALYPYQECNATLYKYLMNGYGGVMKLYPGNVCAHPQTCDVLLFFKKPKWLSIACNKKY